MKYRFTARVRSFAALNEALAFLQGEGMKATIENMVPKGSPILIIFVVEWEGDSHDFLVYLEEKLGEEGLSEKVQI